MMSIKATSLLAFLWLLCTSTAHSDDKSEGLSDVLSKIVGGWETEKIEVLDKQVYGAVSEKDRVTMVFDKNGKVLWTFYLTQSGQEAPMRLNYMLGTDHISFCGGPTGGANEVPIWTMKFEDTKLILATQERGVRFTFRKTRGSAGQPATRSESDSEGDHKPQSESEGRSR
jgi:hypothetical protein